MATWSNPLPADPSTAPLDDPPHGTEHADVRANVEATEQDLADHEADTSNPHQVTAGQTGAAPEGHDHDGDYEPSGTVEAHRTGQVHTEPQPPQSHGNEAHDADFATEGYVDTAVDNATNQLVPLDASKFAVPLYVVRSGKDAEGIFTVIEWYRISDDTLAIKSTLSGGTSPEYTTRTVEEYEADGTTVARTTTYSLSYDGDGDLTAEATA